MAPLIAKQAIVVGAGMGGLTTAAALAPHFEHVLILDADVLREHAEVSHLLKPRSVYRHPELRDRVMAVMTESAKVTP
jgi:2-polyprenyl-6-methoxyphenol hydroxylase-like FAD-dependent oxidoreductase